MPRKIPGRDGKRVPKTFAVIYKVTHYYRAVVKAKDRVEAMAEVEKSDPNKPGETAHASKIEVLGAISAKSKWKI